MKWKPALRLLILFSMLTGTCETLYHLFTWRLLSTPGEGVVLLLLTALLYALFVGVANLAAFIAVKIVTILVPRSPFLARRGVIHLAASILPLLSIPLGTYYRFEIHSQRGWGVGVIGGILLIFLVSVLLSIAGALFLERVVQGGREGRVSLVLSILCAAGALFILIGPFESAGGGSQGGGEGRRNVLLIVVDTMRADFLASAGVREIQTPNMDRLARDGLYFRNVVSQVPLTGPSHLSIFTSAYPFETGVCGNGVPVGDPEGYLPEVMKGHGYTTAAFVSGFPLHSKFGFSKGFDVYDDDFGRIKGIQKTFPMILIDYFTLPGNFPRERRGGETNRRLFQFLKRGPPSPFFIFLHYYDPRAPYNPPPPYDRLYRDEDAPPSREGDPFELHGYWPPSFRDVTEREFFISRYMGEITYADAMIGEVMGLLRDKGLMEETVIIVTSDHGESLGEHDYYFDHGLDLYDPSIMVPLIIRAPGLLPGAGVVTEQADLLDIAPTLYDLFGIEMPSSHRGKSLLPLLHAEESKLSPLSFSATLYTREMETTDLDFSLRTPSRKLILKFQGGEEFYDLSIDPGEEVNLLSKGDMPPNYREEFTFLRGRLEEVRRGGRVKGVEMDRATLEKLKALGYVE